MRCKTIFNKDRDLQEVDQFGFVDISKSIKEGFVPNDLQNDSTAFDGVDIDPEGLLSRPRDTFDAIRMQDNLAEGIKSDLKENSSNTEKS